MKKNKIVGGGLCRLEFPDGSAIYPLLPGAEGYGEESDAFVRMLLAASQRAKKVESAENSSERHEEED